MGGVLAGAAALLYSIRIPQGIVYSGGFLLGIKAFSSAVLGGIGNVRGALLGGLILAHYVVLPAVRYLRPHGFPRG